MARFATCKVCLTSPVLVRRVVLFSFRSSSFRRAHSLGRHGSTRELSFLTVKHLPARHDADLRRTAAARRVCLKEKQSAC
jgi:hypothetical protein